MLPLKSQHTLRFLVQDAWPAASFRNVHSSEKMEENGTACGNRTYDLLIHNQAL